MWPACASPAKPGEIVLPAIWPSRPIAISPDGNRNSPTLMQGPYAAMPGISRSEELRPVIQSISGSDDFDFCNSPLEERVSSELVSEAPKFPASGENTAGARPRRRSGDQGVNPGGGDHEKNRGSTPLTISVHAC